MNEVAILGAGELGGAIADALARRDTAREVRIVDEGSIAAGKALDIMQSSPIEGFATRVSAAADVTAAAGAAIFVVADRARGGEWQGEAAVALLNRLAQIGSRGLIVCAGATQREMVDVGVRELHIAPARLFGCAPEALASAARAIVAVEADASPNDVALTVMGVPPSHVLLPWEDAAIGCAAATSVLDVPTRRRIAARVAVLWPPGPLALAAAAVKAIDAVLGRSRARVSCFVGPGTIGRVPMRTIALPVRLGQDGVAEVELPALTVADRVALDNALADV
jgi:malate/lactate dehydrogenase